MNIVKNPRISILKFTDRTRTKLTIQALSQLITNNTRVLDIGCGNGVISQEIQKTYNCEIIGTDIRNYVQTDIEFKKMSNPRKLEFKDKEFDVGVLNNVLHHIKYDIQEVLINEALRVCSKIIIIEVRPSRLAKFLDFTLNKIRNARIPVTLTHREKEEWGNLFENNKINYKHRSIITPRIYYASYFLFVLTKTHYGA